MVAALVPGEAISFRGTCLVYALLAAGVPVLAGTNMYEVYNSAQGVACLDLWGRGVWRWTLVWDSLGQGNSSGAVCIMFHADRLERGPR